MLTFAQASELASHWVRIISDDSFAILSQETLKRPYGWVFFYQSRAYLASGNPIHQLAGNAPIIVDRCSSEIRVTGTGRPLQTYLDAYEAAMPPARLQMSLPNEPTVA